MADVATLRARSAAFWAGAAPGWAAHADRQDEIGRPLGAAALDWLRVRPGERVLDVGCGCGGTTAELARAVTASGSVLGVDLSEAMVATARERFGPRFLAADIETLDPVPGAPFDAAHSRMTLMLLADPVAGLTTIRRSLRAGGRLAATVFRDGRANPWLPAAMLGAAPHLGPMPPLPIGDEPGPFAFADPARVTRLLTAAGFTDIAVRPHDVTLEAPDSPATVAEWLIEVGPAGAAYREAGPDARERAREGTARLLERFRQPGAGYRLPAGLWLITATNPAPVTRRRAPALLALMLGVAALSGCGGADADAPAAAPPAAQTTTSPAADDCGGAATTVREHLDSTDVSTVTVNGQCTNVTIDTGLDDEDTAEGRRLCEAAGEVAYTGDVNSVTVRSRAGAELSVGIPGMKCLP